MVEDIESFPRISTGIAGATSETSQPVQIKQTEAAGQDPFAAQRTGDNNPFSEAKDSISDLGSSPPIQAGSSPQDRRMSKEWGA